MAHKLDIFKTLDAIDQRDTGYLDRQTEEARKAFHAPVVMRWASGMQFDGEVSDYMLLTVNARANVNFYDIWEHPELQWKLLASCGIGARQKHKWIDAAKRLKTAEGLLGFLSKYWPEANEDELRLLVRQFTRETFLEFVDGCGLEAKDIEDAMTLYDRAMGTDDGKKKKRKAKS